MWRACPLHLVSTLHPIWSTHPHPQYNILLWVGQADMIQVDLGMQKGNSAALMNLAFLSVGPSQIKKLTSKNDVSSPFLTTGYCKYNFETTKQ